MTLAIETHQLTRYFDDFCAVNGIDLRSRAGHLLRLPRPQRRRQIDHHQNADRPARRLRGEDSRAGQEHARPRESLEAKSRIGVIPEDLALFDNLTAREYLTFVGRMYLLPRDTIRSRIDELLPLLGLEGEEKKLTLEYSHGMKKKLALAAALLPNPDLLFLDEPFEGVDAVTSRVIRDLLAGYVARGSTVFLTSHVLEIVEKLCTHVGIIVKGELVEQASLDDIRQGGSLEDRFLEKAGADAEAAHEAQLAGGGCVVNGQHFWAFLWLRWRLRVNQVRRAGPVNAVILAVLAILGAIVAICLFVAFLLLGLFGLGTVPPAMLMFVWDGMVLGFLFFWTVGLVTELQRSEALTLQKFLHLPVSLSGVFLINYLSSLFSLTLLFFLPPMVGLRLGLVLSAGPARYWSSCRCWRRFC